MDLVVVRFCIYYIIECWTINS